MSEKPPSKSANLQTLIHRRDKVLAVLHPPTAAHARIMEKAGCEALFVGTGGVVGAYTGLADVGTATMTECVTIAGWIADSVSIPVITDGDTGHGGIMAVRRMVRECIRAGVAGIRIDDQPIEGKRKTQSAGVEVVPLDQAIARYRASPAFAGSVSLESRPPCVRGVSFLHPRSGREMRSILPRSPYNRTICAMPYGRFECPVRLAKSIARAHWHVGLQEGITNLTIYYLTTYTNSHTVPRKEPTRVGAHPTQRRELRA